MILDDPPQVTQAPAASLDLTVSMCVTYPDPQLIHHQRNSPMLGLLWPYWSEWSFTKNEHSFTFFSLGHELPLWSRQCPWLLNRWCLWKDLGNSCSCAESHLHGSMCLSQKPTELPGSITDLRKWKLEF